MAEEMTKIVEIVDEEKEDKKVIEAREKILEEFMKKYLVGFTVDKDIVLTISEEQKRFGLATNNILYDVDISEEEFKEKVDFLHNVKTQDIKGIKFQYRVITKKGDKFVVKFKSDTVITSDGKIARTKEVLEV